MKCSIVFVQYINLLVLVLTLRSDIRDCFPGNLFVFPAEFVPFSIPCSYCFLVGLFLKGNFNSQVLNKTNSLLLVVLCQVLLCMLILLSKIEITSIFNLLKMADLKSGEEAFILKLVYAWLTVI